MATRSPEPRCHFSLLALLAGSAYENVLSRIADDKYGQTQSKGRAMPHKRMTRDLGVGTATAWAKGIESSAGAAGLDVNSVEGVASSLKGLASGFESSLSGLPTSSSITGAIGNLGSLKSAGADFAAKAEALKPQMDSLAKQGQFAVNFSDFKLPAAVAGVIPAAGFKGTVDRATLNSAVGKLVGSNKIPAQLFSPQAVDIAALEAAALQAKAALNGSIPGGLGNLSRNTDSFVNSLGDPNAPPYTGDDPIIRQRLGLPPIQSA